jgi:hypothetical protein
LQERRHGQLGCHWLSFGRCTGRWWTKAILGGRQWTTSPGFEDRGPAVHRRPLTCAPIRSQASLIRDCSLASTAVRRLGCHLGCHSGIGTAHRSLPISCPTRRRPHGPEIGRYLAGLLAVFLVSDSSEKINVLVTIPSAIAELSMVGYQLAIGVRTPRPAARILAAA